MNQEPIPFTMQEAVVSYLPWLLSAITIYTMFLAGNKHRRTWVIGLINQALWLFWIGASSTWGLLPMNLALWIVYWRNNSKWNKAECQTKKVLMQLCLKDDEYCAFQWYGIPFVAEYKPIGKPFPVEVEE